MRRRRSARNGPARVLTSEPFSSSTRSGKSHADRSAARYAAFAVGHARHAARRRRARQGSRHRVAATRRRSHRGRPLPGCAGPSGRAPRPRDRHDGRRRAACARRGRASAPDRAGNRGDRDRRARADRGGRACRSDSDRARDAIDDEPRRHPPARGRNARAADVAVCVRRVVRRVRGRGRADRHAVRREARDVVVGQGAVGRADRGRREARVGLRDGGRPRESRPRDRRGLHRTSNTKSRS